MEIATIPVTPIITPDIPERIYDILFINGNPHFANSNIIYDANHQIVGMLNHENKPILFRESSKTQFLTQIRGDVTQQ
jgi:hypothetical protein